MLGYCCIENCKKVKKPAIFAKSLDTKRTCEFQKTPRNNRKPQESGEESERNDDDANTFVSNNRYKPQVGNSVNDWILNSDVSQNLCYNFKLVLEIEKIGQDAVHHNK